MKNSLNLNFKAGQLSHLLNFVFDFDFGSIINPKSTYTIQQPRNEFGELIFKDSKFGKLKKDQILVLVISSKLNSIQTKKFDLKVSISEQEEFSLLNKRQKLDFNLSKLAFSGIVIQKGELVKTFEIGDEIFGISELTEEFTSTNLVLEELGNVFLKPKNYTFEESVQILVKEFNFR